MKPDERIEKALEGLLSEEDWKQFQRDVMEDASLRSEYVQAAYLHGELWAGAERSPDVFEDNRASTKPIAFVWSTLGLSAVAACIAILITLWLSPAKSGIEMVATIVKAENCRWAGSELPTIEGARLSTGRLALVEGMATLVFESGAELTIEAPTTLDVLDAMRCRLVEGSLVANVPESAHGFTIDTEEMEVIDLGTRFGLTASGVGDTHLFVFEGEVEVANEIEEVKRFTTGGAYHVGTKPPVWGQEVERSDVIPQMENGWLSVPTSYGNGKDTFVRQIDDLPPAGAHPLLMVKHTDLADRNVRHSYLTFDVSEVDLDALEAVELVLQVRSSGFGFSALVPDSRFAVYGDIPSDWDEATLRWEDAPGLEGARKLATFDIPKGSSLSQVIAASEALTEYIRLAEDGLASLVIVRETGEFEEQGLVHAFASKEHPNSRAPTLRLKLVPKRA